MIIEAAINIKQKLDKYLDATLETRNIQAEFAEKKDIRNLEQIQQVGFESVPPEGTKHLTVNLGGGWLLSFAGNDGVAPDTGLAEGESRVYSSDAGVKKAFARFLKTGIIELNGNADFAVRYKALETAFNQLKSEYDDLVTKTTAIINTLQTWVPIANDGGAALQLASGALANPSASTADITGAKIVNIKVPS